MSISPQNEGYFLFHFFVFFPFVFLAAVFFLPLLDSFGLFLQYLTVHLGFHLEPFPYLVTVPVLVLIRLARQLLHFYHCPL